MGTEALRVVIADDHAFYRDGLARLLRESGIDVVAGVPNGEAAIRAVDETRPDVLVMDLNMPGLSGLEATRRLSERAPTCPVVVLSVSAQEADVADAILAGACGYVLKDGPVEEIVAGIRDAAAGRSPLSPPVATILLRRMSEGDTGIAGARLSGREREVLQLLSEGGSAADIAEGLAIGPTTVRGDATSILLKLQVESRFGDGEH